MDKRFPILRGIADTLHRQIEAADQAALLAEIDATTDNNCWWVIRSIAMMYGDVVRFEVEEAREAAEAALNRERNDDRAETRRNESH